VGLHSAPPPEPGDEHGGLSRIGQLLRTYKFHAREELGPLLGSWLANVIAGAPWRDRVEGIVAVPTHWRRRIQRPFHAADDLAAIVAEHTALPRLPILKRTRAGPHQIGLNYEERVRNVRGAFALRRGVKLRDTRLLLIDDVKTTGATINECARVLREDGAAEVYAAVVVIAGWNRDTGHGLSAI
jgi:ComF family protein